MAEQVVQEARGFAVLALRRVEEALENSDAQHPRGHLTLAKTRLVGACIHLDAVAIGLTAGVRE